MEIFRSMQCLLVAIFFQNALANFTTPVSYMCKMLMKLTPGVWRAHLRHRERQETLRELSH